ncbi:hypothetical protein [Deinococcus carri]|uniref:hypothetical protein n=1 Tax=Deinococcus carri TaxID=1211323 RepID=UPI0031F0A3A6
MSSFDYFRALRTVASLLRFAGRPEDADGLPSFIQEKFIDLMTSRDGILALNARDGTKLTRHLEARTRAPSSSFLMASLVVKAQNMIHTETYGELEHRLSDLFSYAHKRTSRMINYTEGSPYVLQAFLNWRSVGMSPGRMNLRTRITGKEGTPYTFTEDHVPQLLWQSDYDELFLDLLSPFLNTNSDSVMGRRMCSMALIRINFNCTWGEAAQKLDLPVTRTTTVNPTMTSLGEAGLSEEFENRLRRLAAKLSNDSNKIDYGNRRRLLSNFNTVPYEDWQEIRDKFRVQNLLPNSRSRPAAVWVWCQATGGEYLLSPALNQGNRTYQRQNYKLFLRNALPRIEEALLDYKARLLAGQTHFRPLTTYEAQGAPIYYERSP